MYNLYCESFKVGGKYRIQLIFLLLFSLLTKIFKYIIQKKDFIFNSALHT
jgi:hypothetical protein